MEFDQNNIQLLHHINSDYDTPYFYLPLSVNGSLTPPSFALDRASCAWSAEMLNGVSRRVTLELKVKKLPVISRLHKRLSTTTYQEMGASTSLPINPFQNWCTSAMIFRAKAAFFASPLNANWFSGLPSGIL